MLERGHVDAMTIDRYRLGALQPTERDQLVEHLSQCDRCKAFVGEAEADARRFDAHVFARTLPAVEDAGRRRRSAGLSVLWASVGLVAASVGAFVLLPRSPEPYVGVKGGAELRVVAQRGDQQFEVTPGTVLRGGDQIRFIPFPAGARFVAIVAKDGSGQVWTCFPSHGTHSAEVSPAAQALPGSVELDDTQGTETIYAVFSDAPLALDALQQRLRTGEPELRALSGVKDVVVLRFDKDAR